MTFGSNSAKPVDLLNHATLLVGRAKRSASNGDFANANEAVSKVERNRARQAGLPHALAKAALADPAVNTIFIHTEAMLEPGDHVRYFKFDHRIACIARVMSRNQKGEASYRIGLERIFMCNPPRGTIVAATPYTVTGVEPRLIIPTVDRGNWEVDVVAVRRMDDATRQAIAQCVMWAVEGNLPIAPLT